MRGCSNQTLRTTTASRLDVARRPGWRPGRALDFTKTKSFTAICWPRVTTREGIYSADCVKSSQKLAEQNLCEHSIPETKHVHQASLTHRGMGPRPGEQVRPLSKRQTQQKGSQDLWMLYLLNTNSPGLCHTPV